MFVPQTFIYIKFLHKPLVSVTELPKLPGSIFCTADCHRRKEAGEKNEPIRSCTHSLTVAKTKLPGKKTEDTSNKGVSERQQIKLLALCELTFQTQKLVLNYEVALRTFFTIIL